MPITFDGANKIINLPVGITAIDAIEIYSRWKDWTLLSDNSKYEYAFRVLGGDPLGGGSSLDGYYFLNNAAGWRIRPAAADQLTFINGNMFAEDPDTPIFASVVGSYSSTIVLTRATSALAVDTGGGAGGGIGADDVWVFPQTEMTTPNTAGSALLAAMAASQAAPQATIDGLLDTELSGTPIRDIFLDVLAMAKGKIVFTPPGTYVFYEPDGFTIRYTLTKSGNSRLSS